MKKLTYFVLVVLLLACGSPDDSTIGQAAVEAKPEPQTTVPVLQPDDDTTTVDLYETVELVFNASETPDNPFDIYLLKLEVTNPDGETILVEGFYDGDGQGGQTGNVWKARLSPDMLGVWQWETVPGDAVDNALVGQTGSFTVVESNEPGGVVADGRYFRYQNGEPVYLLGNFLDFAQGLRTTHVFMSETTTDAQRDAIMERQTEFHDVNKANIYFANVGDYDGQSVTPWVGTASNSDKTQMDLARWNLYDEYILRFKANDILAEMWFFADDSNFGRLTQEERERLLRYGMARTSAFSHTLYVISLEWQEAFQAEEVRQMGQFLQEHNPWDRLISVHTRQLLPWEFPGEDWITFIASQAGNGTEPDRVNSYTIEIRETDDIPHLSEEFGFLRRDSVPRLRSNLWATFLGGAAGSGTGSDLKAFRRFLDQSQVPYYNMEPANGLVEDGGNSRFVLAQPGAHYVIYSSGGEFELEVTGNELQAQWFNPRDPEATLQPPFAVDAGTQVFTPPGDVNADWVLWITGEGTTPPPPPPPPPPGYEFSFFLPSVNGDAAGSP